MKKSLILLIIGVLAMAARADDRKLTGGEYWIDQATNDRVQVSIDDDGLMQFTVEAGFLREGLHALHYRAKDSEGSYSPTQTWLFYCYVNDLAGSTTIEYWFDERDHQTKVLTDAETNFVVDASDLDEGLHAFHYQLLTANGQGGTIHTWLFFRVVPNQTDGVCSLEYWIDDEEMQSVDSYSSETPVSIDASSFDEGLHTLNYRVKGSTGRVSPTQSWLFFRVMPKQADEVCTLEYWIDDEQMQTVDNYSSETPVSIDAVSVAEGLHKLSYRLKGSGGRVSPTQQWLFYKIPTAQKAKNISYYRIWWNDYQDKAIDVQLPNGHSEYLYQELLAMPEYAKNDGFSRNNTARINILFCDDQGNFSPIVSAEVGYPDVYPPVTTLTASKTADGIVLSWMSNEDTVRDWNVYYSENGEPYLLWKSNIKEQTATFRGQQGTTYKFIVTARDVNGNYEAIEESKSVKVTF